MKSLQAKSQNTKNSVQESFSKDALPLLPVRDIVIFPCMIVPLLVGRSRSIKALDDAMQKDQYILTSAQKSLGVEEPAEKDIYSIGTISKILQLFKLPDGSARALIEGKVRARVRAFLSKKDYFKVSVEPLYKAVEKTKEIEALTRSVVFQFEQYVKLNPKLPPEVTSSIAGVEDIGQLTDIIASHLTVKVADRQSLLETVSPDERLNHLARLLNSEMEILQIEKKIMGNVRKQMERAQKEIYLQEQLKAIEKELGRKDDYGGEVKELKEKILKSKMSKGAEKVALRELDKLARSYPMSPEATVIRNYVDWLVSLPWSQKSKDKLNVKEAERVLNEDHYGLEKPKERILEYLAVQKLAKKMKGEILCFVGPPGVGKTSLARSIARALGRNFVRLSLGGVRDEAEIRGHRRTYIGALPGRIIQSMAKAKTKNPVFLLDEIDKMSMDFRGDPSSALLEVLDPEQNHTFSDHYLEVEFDLSDVMFITTSNIQENIPEPLQDRMEIIKLPGYTEYEKVKIATQFLIKKQIKSNGLKGHNLSFSEDAVMNIIRKYTREAGVRNLEREIARICRKVAREVVTKGDSYHIRIAPNNLHKFLGPPQYPDDRIEMKNGVGVATGLAWTEVGGDIMSVESSVVKGKGNLTLTGKLGDVMKESAHAALTYIRSRARQLRIPEDFYRKVDIHIHVPEGAIPKDGPSAGITMGCALVSNLTRRPVRKDVAMTGEITLRGNILPVGGLKSKILAAHRARMKTVLIPRENEKDLEDIPKNVRKELDIKLVNNMDEVLKIALMEGKK
jgi:ATP-dependent Lon protease